MDLSRLLPKQKPNAADNHRMDLINYHGRSYWVPAADRDNQAINCYRRWEQTFSTYSGVYTMAHPSHANEFFQYMETINSAANTFTWDNMYSYDQTFRHLIEKFPYRSWAVTYQHGWSVMVKEHLPKSSFQGEANFRAKQYKG